MLPRVVDPRQIKADAQAGKLGQLVEEALRDYREGKCIRLS